MARRAHLEHCATITGPPRSKCNCLDERKRIAAQRVKVIAGNSSRGGFMAEGSSIGEGCYWRPPRRIRN